MSSIPDEPKPDNVCPTCGSTHSLCLSPLCSNPTHCPPDEPGEPFTRCDACDAALAQPGESEAPLTTDRKNRGGQ